MMRMMMPSGTTTPATMMPTCLRVEGLASVEGRCVSTLVRPGSPGEAWLSDQHLLGERGGSLCRPSLKLSRTEKVNAASKRVGVALGGVGTSAAPRPARTAPVTAPMTPMISATNSETSWHSPSVSKPDAALQSHTMSSPSPSLVQLAAVDLSPV